MKALFTSLFCLMTLASAQAANLKCSDYDQSHTYVLSAEQGIANFTCVSVGRADVPELVLECRSNSNTDLVQIYKKSKKTWGTLVTQAADRTPDLRALSCKKAE